MIVVPGHTLAATQELGHAVVRTHAGAHGGHLQRQVIDILGTHPHDGLHLRGGFNLEHADGIAPAQVLENAVIAIVDAAQIGFGTGAVAHQAHRLLHLRQRAQGQQVDFQDAGIVNAVLVPVGHVAALNGRRLDRHQVGERRGTDQHPAGVLGQSFGKSRQLLR